MNGYYRKFTKGYDVICKPLYELLRKDEFKWNEGITKVLHTLKEIMCITHVLALPDFSQPFILKTNASRSGIGAVLSQGGRLIAYLSKVLGVKNMAHSTYEKEFLALLIAIEK